MTSKTIRLYRSAKQALGIRVLIGVRRIVFSALLCAPLALMPVLAQANQVSPSDPCKTFLSSGFTAGSVDENSRISSGVTPAVGSKAATLSLLLGVRLALGPAEDLNGMVKNASSDAELTALDIQRYRTCKKEQALRVSYVVK